MEIVMLKALRSLGRAIKITVKTAVRELREYRR